MTRGKDLWFRGRLRLLTSAPRTQGGMSRIKFDPPLEDNECGDVTMLVLDFAGVPLWQYSCLKKVAQDPVTGPLAGLMRWANQPTIASPSNVFKGTFQDTDILSSLPDKLRCLDEEQLQTIRGISSSDAPIQFIHALAGTGKTHVLKCLLHGWNRIRETGTFVVVALRTRELREEMWRDLLDILPEDSLMTVGQPPSPPAGSTAPQRHDAPTERFTKLVLSKLGPLVTELEEAKGRLADALQALDRHVKEHKVPEGWVCREVDVIMRGPHRDLRQLTDAYRTAGAIACRAQWALFQAWADAVAEVVAKVAAVSYTPLTLPTHFRVCVNGARVLSKIKTNNTRKMKQQSVAIHR